MPVGYAVSHPGRNPRRARVRVTADPGAPVHLPLPPLATAVLTLIPEAPIQGISLCSGFQVPKVQFLVLAPAPSSCGPVTRQRGLGKHSNMVIKQSKPYHPSPPYICILLTASAIGRVRSREWRSGGVMQAAWLFRGLVHSNG